LGMVINSLTDGKVRYKEANLLYSVYWHTFLHLVEAYPL
jgi:hypothetical protein